MSPKIGQFVDKWIKFHDMLEEDPRRDDYWPEVSEVMDWHYSRPERLWQFILLVYRRKPSQRVVSNLAAGPLEDLLSIHGYKFIERIMTLARTDIDFNHLLGGVWQNAMPDEIWKILQAVRNEVW